ncbi:MAG TPA: DnaJ domain-containing protein [Allosphingosinicella sp.]|jgi:curved DNA-binding protein CbpA|nr:DnaJ domain-containing protein [Allosphingosinicella sp.]
MAGVRSLYDVLNVAPEAEPVVVEAAYKALIKKYHPDQAVEAPVSKDATAINEAFAILKDPAKRADYDHRLWTKQQAIRLAEAQVASAGRPPRYVAVSGWLIAGLLACALAAVAMGKSLGPPPMSTPAEAAEVVDSEAPARAAALKAAAAEDVHDRALPSSASVIARVRAEQGFQPMPRLAPAPRAAASGASRSRKARPAPRARAEPRKESDFLERQGYIY